MTDPRQILQLYDPRKLGLFLVVLIDIGIVRFLLMWMKIPALLERLDGSSRERRAFKAGDFDRAKLGWKYANFFLVDCLRVRNPCLLRSLVLFHLFRRQGLDARIHFGVRDSVSPLEGHSWLSANGVPFLEQKDPRSIYFDVYSYPPS